MTVMSGLMESIIMSTPIIIVTEVISCVMLWFKLCPSVSTSFVIRESTSPTVLDSKYFMGIRLIFSEISRRIRKHSFWVIPVISQPWIKLNRALTR